MYTEDRYYEPEDDEDDEEAFNDAVVYWTETILRDEYPMPDEDLWADALKALGYTLEQYPTQSHHAPMIVVKEVEDFYATLAYDKAIAHVEKYGYD